MSTLCLSDMGELRDEWLREPRPASLPAPSSAVPASAAVDLPTAVTPRLAGYLADEAVAA